MDSHPNGANAVVCVISYTGYDMEDAMIINKGSYDRGFAHASVYKTVTVDLRDGNRSRQVGAREVFGVLRRAKKGRGPDACQFLDADGLAPVGRLVKYGEAIACIIDQVSGKMRIIKHKETEAAWIDEVRLISSGTGKDGRSAGRAGQGANNRERYTCASEKLQTVRFKLRFRRNPVVGDKFSSRHGQKGVMSILWPQENMPFTEHGMTPDIIINPHAFPSRMTIGMLIESMAGKGGSLNGTWPDASPFQFSETRKATEYFGDHLKAAGYNYYGSETMYSGTGGLELQADIYIGVVYYQRLRHMVSDKAQVRATGRNDTLTRQPLKGRKRGGGVRFGEMERDSLLAHGASFLIRDRLLNCSDHHIAYVCNNPKCMSMLAPMHDAYDKWALPSSSDSSRSKEGRMVCTMCQRRDDCRSVAMPYVFRYLMVELAAMNIKLSLTVSEG